MKKRGGVARKIAYASASAAVAAAIALGTWSFSVIRNIPDVESLAANRVAESTKIYDRTGTILLYELYGEEKRTIIPFDRIPDLAKKATIAVEDRNFYVHDAIDWKSLLRAFVVNLSRAGVVQGGSTITQQLAKNAFLAPDRTIARKMKELFLSYRLESRYSKDEILNLYLNQIPYGSNAYGIEAAARTYFGKEAGKLELKEIALLVSLPKAPSYYSPWGTHAKELFARKDRTLDQMASAGYITERERDEAKKADVSFAPQSASIRAPHFAMAIQGYLTETYGDDFVRTGGMKVTTTLDWDLQQIAEKAVADGARRNEELYKGTNAALVAEDPKTGQILALVGSRDYFDREIDGNFDVAMQGLRQPGSSIKPFTYCAAFMRGLSPDTVLFDVETEFDATGDPERSYKPGNFDDTFRGPINLRDALAQSINIPAVKTLYIAGIDNVIRLAHAAGITTLNERNRYGLSLTLGGGEVKLIDMVGAYSTLSQDGMHHRQSFILGVEDGGGKTLEKYADVKDQALPQQAVRLVNDILSDADARAPLFGASSGLTSFANQEVALKTGTTNDYRDAWTFGYTPSLVVGVWAGNNDNKPLEKHGGSILAAVPIWSAFMKEALKGKPFEPFPRPDETIADKPVLNGDYAVNGEIHSILYYIDRKNPLGDAPQSPEKDSQFKNWEDGIIAWMEKNPSFVVGIPVPATSSQAVAIDFLSPKNGEFAISPFVVQASIAGREDVIRIETYLNDRLIGQESIQPTKEISYRTTVSSPLDQQNKLTIRAFTAKDSTAKDMIIFGR